MNEEFLLEKIGLTGSEAKVYLASLELGLSTTGPLVDKSGIASSKIYEILDRLKNKGLVGFIMKGNTKYFEAGPAERLIDYVEEKEEQVQNQKKEIINLIPILNQKKKTEQQSASIFTGMKGLNAAFQDALSEMEKGDLIAVTGVPNRSEKVNRYFVNFAGETRRKGVQMDVLFDESARKEPQTEIKGKLNNVRFIKDGILTPAAINVFKETTLIFPAEEGGEPLIIKIKSKNVADSFRAQFKVLWENFSKE